MNNQDIEIRINNCIAQAKIELNPKFEIASLALVALAVKLEKEFQIRFELDEICSANFSSIQSILDLVLKKMKVE